MSEPHQSGDELDDYKEQDRFLPIANVARIMKKALPDNAKIAKEAKETVQECVSEFISFITSEGMVHFCSTSPTALPHLRTDTLAHWVREAMVVGGVPNYVSRENWPIIDRCLFPP